MTAVELIKSFEGCKLKAYQDQGGIWTVGWGCTGPGIGPGTEWTQAQADSELAQRVDHTRQQVVNMTKVELTPNQLAAITCFAYNVGLGAYYRSNVRRYLSGGFNDEAMQSLLNWCHVGGKEVPGLLRRRQAEKALFTTPDDSD